MDNAGFEKDRRSAVEMGEVSSPSPEASLATLNGNGVPGCTDACLALHQQHQKSLQQYQKSTTPRPSDSPWHYLKTIFLITTVASLIVWVLVYTVLSQMAVVWLLHLARTVQGPSPKVKHLTLNVQSSVLHRAAKKYLRKWVNQDKPHNLHIYQLLHLYVVVNYIRNVLYLDQILFTQVLDILTRILFHTIWLWIRKLATCDHFTADTESEYSTDNAKVSNRNEGD